MISFSEDQLTIILAFYYFDGKKIDEKRIKTFADRFMDYYKVDISSQNISYEISKFKNVNPSFNSISINDNERYRKLWIYYVEEDRIDLLKKIYFNFRNNAIKNNNIIEIDDKTYNELIDSRIQSLSSIEFEDKPKEKYKESNNSSIAEIRDLNVAFNSLKKAGFLCEYDNSHPVFLRKNIAINYTEGHHLIPLKYQHLFDVNLDVEANVVSLCSNCHNNIHYGRDFKTILKKLYDERKDRLERCGIHISFEDLIKLYE